MKINIIVAYANNYVIGYNNDIPWHYKEDLQYFKTITCHTEDPSKKNIVIMGYNTHISLPNQFLKNRINIVITTKELENNEDLYYVDSLGRAIELCNELITDNKAEKIFIIGGESIYSYYIKSYYYKYLDKVYITRINKDYGISSSKQCLQEFDKGNKHFYGLEDKFYYISVLQSILHPEIEYRVLQYQNDFLNPETVYLEYLRFSTKEDDHSRLELEIDLSKYFPVFSFVKTNINTMLNTLFISLQKDEIKNEINKFIEEIKNNASYTHILDCSEIKPFDSIYNLSVVEDNLLCITTHNKGNILNEVVYNILFSSLLTSLLIKTLNLTGGTVKYSCIEPIYTEKDIYTIDKIAWNTPDVMCKIEINSGMNKYKIEEYTINDIKFYGLNI
jgi:dihydrofolate reductase